MYICVYARMYNPQPDGSDRQNTGVCVPYGRQRYGGGVSSRILRLFVVSRYRYMYGLILDIRRNSSCLPTSFMFVKGHPTLYDVPPT